LEVDDSVVISAALENHQTVLFEKEVIARDNHCAVTKKYAGNQVSRILADSWWANLPNRRQRLPKEIVDVITALGNEINHVKNGILLHIDLAWAFDKGYFSFKFENGHYCVIAITPDYEEYDGIVVDENLRVREDGSYWWSPETWPDKTLVEFHFRNSVFKNMKAGDDGENNEWSDDDESADEKVSLARMSIEKFFSGARFGKKIASDTFSDVADDEK